MSSDDETGSGETLSMRFWRIPRPKRRYLKKQLPELKEESRMCIENFLSYRAPRTRAEFPRSRSAAVLVALFIGREGDLYVLLSRRAAELRTYAGDTVLPGGKVEPEDKSIEDTARREAYEEIGLPQDRVKVPLLCVMEPFLARNQVIVTPVVVLILDKTLQPHLNESEVETLFSHPLRSFLDSNPPFPTRTSEPYHTWSDHPFGETGTTRVHRFLTGREAGGIKPVFGLTANILIAAASLGYGRPPSFEVQPPNAPTPRQQIARAIIMPGSALQEACVAEGINPDHAAGRLLRPPYALNAPRVLEWSRIGAQWDDLLSDDEDTPKPKVKPAMVAAATATATADPASAVDIEAATRRGFVPPKIPTPPTPPTPPESGPAANGKNFRGDGFGKNYRGPGRRAGWDQDPADPTERNTTRNDSKKGSSSSTDASESSELTPSSGVPNGPQGPTVPTGTGMEDPEQSKAPLSIERFVGRMEREIERRIAHREGRPPRPESTYPKSTSGSEGAKKTAKVDGADTGNGLMEVNLDAPIQAEAAPDAVADGSDEAPQPAAQVPGEDQSSQPTKPINPRLERIRRWGEESRRKWQPDSNDGADSDSDSDSDPTESGEGREWKIPRMPKREDGQESRWSRRRREKREQRQKQQEEGEQQERPRRQWRWPTPPQRPNGGEKHDEVEEAPHTFEKPVPAPPVSPEVPKVDAASAAAENVRTPEVVAPPLDPAEQARLDEKAAKQAEREAARAAKHAANQEELAQLTGFKKLGRFLDQTKEMVQERYDELSEDEEKLAIARARYPVVKAEIQERLASVRRGDWKKHMAAHMSGGEYGDDGDDEDDEVVSGHDAHNEQPHVQITFASADGDDETVDAAKKERTVNPKAKESIERGKRSMHEGIRRLGEIEGYEEGRRSGMERMREGLKRGLKNAREGVDKGKDGVSKAAEVGDEDEGEERKEVPKLMAKL